MTPAEGRKAVDMFCPVDPQRVIDVTFPPYDNLPDKAKGILEASQLEHPPQNTSGRALYDSAELSRPQRAGLLNLVAKMGRTLGRRERRAAHVNSFYRLRADRVFANVSLALRDLVRTAYLRSSS